MSAPERLLLHTCCAPCLIAPARQLKDEGISFTAWWFNPNIHPVTEYRQRLQSLREFASREGFGLIVQDEYGLRDFVRAVAGDLDQRCRHCYSIRLEAAAKAAAALGCDAFSTTLLYSKYQKHELLRELAEEAAAKHGVGFFYRDWRPLWDEGRRLAKEAELYRQKYCGCVFSEEERYLKVKP